MKPIILDFSAFSIILLVCLLSFTTNAKQGVDVSTLVTNWSCLKNAGYSFAVARAWQSFGAFDQNVLANIRNAKAAGITNVDVYMFPCRGKSASS